MHSAVEEQGSVLGLLRCLGGGGEAKCAGRGAPKVCGGGNKFSDKDFGLWEGEWDRLCSGS